MGTIKARTKGKAEELTGALKKRIGKALGNKQMEDEGAARELKGQARQEAAKTVERAKGAVEQVVGAAKREVGQILDDPIMTAKGKAKQLKGKARQKLNK